ncbi:MAG: NigD-like C-terminal domain-containing protein [Bacteroidales bacterium]|nr:NigD-like C-terminal domain-containing protein [Bacteroidales bacterium]
MKNLIRLFFSFILFSTLLFNTSCLPQNEVGNFQTFEGQIGTIITYLNLKCFRMDADGTLLSSPVLNQYEVGDRIVSSFSINYDDQTAGVSYLVAEFQSIEKIKTNPVFDITAIEKDTFKNDPINTFTYSYLSLVQSKIYFTTQTYFYASNKYHSFDLIRNNLTTSDTIKLEIRHNAKLDTDNQHVENTITSYDVSTLLSSVPIGGSKVVEITYNVTSAPVKQYITYTRPTPLD